MSRIEDILDKIFVWDEELNYGDKFYLKGYSAIELYDLVCEIGYDCTEKHLNMLHDDFNVDYTKTQDKEN